MLTLGLLSCSCAAGFVWEASGKHSEEEAISISPLNGLAQAIRGRGDCEGSLPEQATRMQRFPGRRIPWHIAEIKFFTGAAPWVCLGGLSED